MQIANSHKAAPAGEHSASPHLILGKLMKSIASLSLCTVLFLAPAFAQESETKPNALTAAFDKSAFDELLKDSKIQEAAAMLDQELAKDPVSEDLQSLDFLIANRLMRSDANAANQRLGNLVDRLSQRTELSPKLSSALSMAVNSYASQLARSERVGEARAITEKALEALKRSGDSALTARRSTETLLARIAMEAGNKDEAKSILLAAYEDAEKSISKDIESPRNLVTVVGTFGSMFRVDAPKEAADLMQRAESFFEQRIQRTKDVRDLDAYVSLKSTEISANVYSDPEKGLKLANDLMSKIEAFDSAKETELKALSKRIEAMIPNLEKSLARFKLIGTDAPDYDAQSFVGMDAAKLSELRGKVVLLDFWAVWCGPCIATFPHLIDWQERYAEKGFTVLGITSDQGYVWDEKNGRAVRGENVSHEEELEMLEAFRAHHRLKHGFVILPKGSDYNKQLMVSGIPQAVLVDKLGKIRMIKIGSGETNANALEAEIEKLLAE
jgi:thiol-disulfide isomerase/thioredoxin